MFKLITAVLIFLTLIGVSNFLIPSEALARVEDGGGGGDWLPSVGGDNADIKDLEIVIRRIITFLLAIVGAVSIILIAWGGMRYILSGGEEKSLAAAKSTITFAIIGLIIVLLAIFIVNVIGNILGAKDLDIIKIGS